MESHLLILSAATHTNTPVLLWGAPGIGKTATIQAIAEALDLPLEIVIASIREPADFSGLPVLYEGRVHMAPPAWAQRLAEAGRGLLFLDEISTAPPAVQAALLRVVLDRVVGELALPEGVAIVAAANPPDQAAGGWELAPPLANRFAHIDWPSPRVADWARGLISGWSTPAIPNMEGWREQLPVARALVSSFLQARPHLLARLPEDAAGQGKAWPSPRSWEMATRLLAAVLTQTQDEGHIAQVVGSCVGAGVGIELAALVGGELLPNPREMLEAPTKCELPERADKLLVALEAVASYTLDTLDRTDLTTDDKIKTWRAAWVILNRAAKERQVDVAASSSRALSNAWLDQYTRPDRLRLPMDKSMTEPFRHIIEQANPSEVVRR